MARYFRSTYGRRRDRNRRKIYIIAALLIIGAVIVFAYHPFGKDTDEIAPPPAEINLGGKTAAPAVEQPAPAPIPEPEPKLVEVVPEPTDESDPEVSRLIDKAMALIKAKPAKIIEARYILNDVLPMAMSRRQRAFIKQRLSELADEWLFSRKILPQDTLCGSYKVEHGDQFRVISNRFKVPHEILMKINRIPRPELLRAGDQIKIINGPFHAKVYLSTFTMDLYLQKTFIRTFSIGIGQAGMDTPTGLWVVKVDGKLIEPQWPDPVSGKILHAGDPGYALGSRWIGLDGIEGAAKGRTGFGIHGTKDPESIRTASSRGCIRLHNGDVKLVYDLLIPRHSQVVVVE
ncbi:MAG: L,D-transpeptidase family protein [Planctomycetota bacterium]|jgi:hypothetical protein